MLIRLATAAIAGAIAVTGMLTAPPASAGVVDNVLCNAVGRTLVTQSGGNVVITVKGLGRCSTGDGFGPYLMALSGTGSANGDGNCNGGLPVASALNINVHLNMVSVVSTTKKRQFDLIWKLPVTTFPRIAEFTVREAGQPIRGAGAILTGKTVCEGDQNSTASTFDFDFIHSINL
ncbi:MAG: hypothetical protein QOG53_2004 [Frankiales bacterium]|jgi:hypothetical protein|nr:hypothetical protein [Frankiales bacterium]